MKNESQIFKITFTFWTFTCLLAKCVRNRFFFVGAYANCEINAIKSIVLILASSLDSMRDSLVLHSADVRRKSFLNCFPKCSNHQYTSIFFVLRSNCFFYYADRTVYQSYQIVSPISLHVRSFLLLKNESEIFR